MNFVLNKTTAYKRLHLTTMVLYMSRVNLQKEKWLDVNDYHVSLDFMLVKRKTIFFLLRVEKIWFNCFIELTMFLTFFWLLLVHKLPLKFTLTFKYLLNVADYSQKYLDSIIVYVDSLDSVKAFLKLPFKHM